MARPRSIPTRLAVAVLSGLLASCSTPALQNTRSPEFSQRFGEFTYAEVEVVRQSESRSCGLAVLACVLRYWDRPVTESALLQRHPIRSGVGHSLQTLHSIASEEGLLAFALALKPGAAGSPAAQLSGHLEKGRPVIVAVRLPQGRYFSDPVPVLGTLDARTVRPFGLVPSPSGDEYKLHYVVVFGEDASRYLLMDPAYGIVAVPKTSLLQWWRDLDYAALLCSPRPSAASTPSTP